MWYTSCRVLKYNTLVIVTLDTKYNLIKYGTLIMGCLNVPQCDTLVIATLETNYGIVYMWHTN